MTPTPVSPQPRLRWYAIRCDSAKHVLKVGVGITNLRARAFIPMHYREEKQGKWLVSVESGLLFPPYLFVGTSRGGADLWSRIMDLDGVERIMGCRNREGDLVPLAIPYQEMRKIRTKHQAGERKKAADRFKPGQRVMVVEGPFTSFEGIFQKPENERVLVLLSLFGRETPVHLQESDVRAA